MQVKSSIVTIMFKSFEVGDIVTPTSSRCPLPEGIYEVTYNVDPLVECGELHATVFVKGHKFGVSGEYLDVVKPIATDKTSVGTVRCIY